MSNAQATKAVAYFLSNIQFEKFFASSAVFGRIILPFCLPCVVAGMGAHWIAPRPCTRQTHYINSGIGHVIMDTSFALQMQPHDRGPVYPWRARSLKPSWRSGQRD
jgi:hypothetical protein